MSKEKDKEEILEEEIEKEAEEDMREGNDLVEAENKIKELEEEIKNLKDEDLRNRAETENYRKRLLKDKENAVRYANESLIKDLLDPIDNFSRAIQAATSSEDFNLKSSSWSIKSPSFSIEKRTSTRGSSIF